MSGDVNDSVNSHSTAMNSSEEKLPAKGGHQAPNQNSISQMTLPVTDHKEETQEIKTRAQINIGDKGDNSNTGAPAMLLTAEEKKKEIGMESILIAGDLKVLMYFRMLVCTLIVTYLVTVTLLSSVLQSWPPQCGHDEFSSRWLPLLPYRWKSSSNLYMVVGLPS